MKYVLLAVGDEKVWEQAGPAEREAVFAGWERFDRLLKSRNADRGGEELASSATATTVRKDGDQVIITDGPYAEATEQIGGFVIVEARDLDEAIEFAKACPSGTVEIRPVVEYQG
ncbi:YciI family protein [Planobispora takensis]|uniref:YCII-related domain-containing protein n=1 Tax=Planobispora takensis TaxID=1367882 RepID=A0A8J3WV19_9ACTN|nr:YciI family protein [Planobispora takensis]GII03341.1 hypothetical protein Pta02_53490 [Planobispora takensis]